MTEGLLSDHLLVVDLRERTERRLHEAGYGHWAYAFPSNLTV